MFYKIMTVLFLLVNCALVYAIWMSGIRIAACMPDSPLDRDYSWDLKSIERSIDGVAERIKDK